MPRALTYRRRRHGNPGTRAPVLACCPNCGFDLKTADPVQYGDLWADPRGDTFWQGKLVKITQNERIILHSLLTGKPPRSQNRDWQPGAFIDRLVLAERADCSIDSIDVVVSNIRMKFRQVDPEFNHIETRHGEGYRWSAIRVPQPIARWGSGTFVLYDNGEVVWRQRFRLWLSPQETKTLKALLEAKGEYMTWQKLSQVVGYETDSAARASVNRLRRKFAEADAKSPAVHCDAPGRYSKGYKVVKPDFEPEKTPRQQAYAKRRATGWKPPNPSERRAQQEAHG